MKKIIGYCLFFIIILPILIVNLVLIVKTKMYPNKIADFLGYRPFIVLSGSMETKINIGDLIIVKEVDSKNIKKGDIIAFIKSLFHIELLKYIVMMEFLILLLKATIMM